ncbi:MAG: MATE family efflux transporter [Rhodospirillales bacterium]|nr:MATE family efflux transporter [Rhodospirillales bacterium]
MIDETAAPPPPAAPKLGRQIKDLLRLALPVIGSRLGMLTMALADTVMLGRFAARELAYQSIAIAVTIPLFVTAIGLCLGTLVATARANGAGRFADCGAAWRRGLVYAAGLGTVCLCLALAGEWALELSGQNAELSREGGRVVRVLALGLPFMIIYISCAYFMEALKRPTVPMFLMIAANLLNIFLNWMWIYGNLGFPSLGAVGSAWASTSVRAGLAAALILYIWNLHDHERLGVRSRAGGGWRAWREQRRIGYSAGASQAVESMAFSLQTLIAGLLGTIALAAYSIAFQMLGMMFMVALGIGSATAVLVGHAWGARDVPGMARAGWLGLGVNSVAMLALGGLVFALAPSIAEGFAVEAALIAAAAPLIAFIGIVLLFDGGQVVLSHALRGRGDALVPVLTHSISYLMVMIPLSWFLALKAGRGPQGILEAILIASLVLMALLAWRFHFLAKRGSVS